MAKVTITMTVDIPGIESYSDAELSQNLFDDMINYMTVSHFHDAVEWMARSKGDESSTEMIISRHHSLWGKIVDSGEWTFEREIEMTDRIVEHDYVNASNNIAQYEADQCDRQQVTIEQYSEYWAQYDIPVWKFNRLTSDMGLDPWFQVNDRLDKSMIDDNIYFVGNDEVDGDFPLFIQKRDMLAIEKEE